MLVALAPVDWVQWISPGLRCCAARFQSHTKSAISALLLLQRQFSTTLIFVAGLRALTHLAALYAIAAHSSLRMSASRNVAEKADKDVTVPSDGTKDWDLYVQSPQAAHLSINEFRLF